MVSTPPANSKISRHAVSMNRKGDTVLSCSSTSRGRCSFSTLKLEPASDDEEGGGVAARSNFFAPGSFEAR